MANFKKSFVHVLGREGKFSNDAHDRGGATMYGITIGRYSEYLGRPASVAEVKAITVTIAEAIYKKYYWKPMGCDGIVHDGVACAFFDQGVNRGTVTVIKVVQKIVGTVVDGYVGPKTLKAINSMNGDILIEKIALQAESAYRAIVKRNPSQKKFLKGWLNRANHLRTLKSWD